jgi:predicted dehydrogenase
MKEQLNWGVVGTGGIATDFVEALQLSKRCHVVNVTGSSPEKARAFADRWRLPSAAGSLEEMVADPTLEAVYVASPHPSHEVQALACIEAGKHVLCEKPITMDEKGAARVVDAAKRRGVFLMEAYMYRCHPLMRELVERLRGGVIGAIRHVRADFGFRVPRDPKGRLFDKRLGGGSVLDVGGYPVSFSRLVAGIVAGGELAEPTRVDAVGSFGPTGADEITTALLRFESGFTATVTSAVHCEVGTTAVVFGEDGKLVLPDPWIPKGERQGLETGFTVHRDGRQPEPVSVRTPMPTYALEAELVADTLPDVQAKWPAMSWDDTLANMRVMDAWQAALAAR